MKPKEFFLSLNKNGIPDEAWNYLQTEIIPDAQLDELTEGNVYFRETAKALNTFYPDALSESVKLNLKSIFEATEPKPEREPEPEPIEEPTPEEPAKPQASKKEVRAAVKKMTIYLRYAKDKKKFDSIKKAINAVKLRMKYMKDGGVMKHNVLAKGGELWYKYDFNTKEEFFDYIDESRVNGQFSQVRELWEEMPSSMRQEFMRYAKQQGYDETIQYINENVLAKGGEIKHKKGNGQFLQTYDVHIEANTNSESLANFKSKKDAIKYAKSVRRSEYKYSKSENPEIVVYYNDRRVYSEEF